MDEKILMDVVRGVERIATQQDNLSKSMRDTQTQNTRTVERIHARLDDIRSEMEAHRDLDNIQEERLAMLQEASASMQDAAERAKDASHSLRLILRAIVVVVIALLTLSAAVGSEAILKLITTVAALF